MGKLVVLGDPHITDTNVPAELLRRRLNYLRTLPVQPGDVLVCLGDIHHTKNKLTPEQHWILQDLLTLWAGTCETYILQGNHDVASTRSDESHVEAIITRINSDRLHYVKEPQLVSFRSLRHISGLFIPWHWEQATYIGQAASLASDRQDPNTTLFGFGHFGIKDFAYDNGRVSRDDVDSKALSGLSCWRLFCGHFHIPQVQRKYGLTIDFIGSAFDTQYRHVDAPRGGLVTVEDSPGVAMCYYSPPTDTFMLDVHEEHAFEYLNKFIEEGPVCMRVVSDLEELAAQATSKDEHHLLLVREPPPPQINREATLALSYEGDRSSFAINAIHEYIEHDCQDLDLAVAALKEAQAIAPSVPDQFTYARPRVMLEQVHLENFMAHVDTKVEFTPGLTLLDGVTNNAYSGSVGAGKSSIIEAVKWALHGKLLREGVPAASVLRAGAPRGQGCRVSLRYAVSGRVSTLMRYRSDPIYGNVGVRVESNGAVHEQDSAESYVQVSTGLTDTVFRAAVCFGRATKQLLTATGSSQRKAILAELTGASDVFTGWAAKVREAQSANDIAITKREREVSDLRAEATRVYSALETRRGQHDNWERTHGEKLREVLEKSNVLSVKLAQAQHAERRMQQCLEAAGNRVDRLSTTRSSIGRNLDKTRSALNDVLGKLEGNDKCPKCGYSAVDIDVLATTRDDIRLEEARYEKQYAEWDAKLDEARTAKNTYRQLYRSALDVLTKYETAAAAAEAESTIYQQAENPYRDYVTFEETYEELSAKLGDAIAALEACKARQPALSYLSVITGPNGLPVFLIEKAIPQINAEANRILDAITGGSLRINLNTRTGGGQSRHQHIDFSVENARGCDVYASNSDGEQHLESFALMLAAVKYADCCNLVFVDELFDNVDTSVAVKMLDVCIEFAQENGICMIATTHKDDLKPSFPRVITVVNDGKGAYIEDGND